MKISKDIVAKGTDISKWQGTVDFVKMKQEGIAFVIIRAGYGETQDKMFNTYINNALRAGISVGVYWFIYAKDKTDIIKNVHKFHQVIETYKDKITCGVWADWEYDSDKKAGFLTIEQRSEMVGEFCKIMIGYRYDTGIYANMDYIQNKFTSELVAAYPLWYARYEKKIGSAGYKGKDGHPYIWQYSSKGTGKVYGVESKYVDLDYAYFQILDKSTNNISEAASININPYLEPTSNIRKGTRGEGTKWVQWYLWRFGLLEGAEIDGVIGTKSEAAIRIAQKRLGLVVDGIVGKNTRQTFKMVFKSGIYR
jgi:Lyzozyme M1 (1,4-beta-N-acetylmuramidase)